MLLTICIVFGLIIAGVVFWNVSPIQKRFLIKKAFEGGMFVQSNNYKNALKETRIVKDINYNSKFPDGTLDIIYPKNLTGKNLLFFGCTGVVCMVEINQTLLVIR